MIKADELREFMPKKTYDNTEDYTLQLDDVIYEVREEAKKLNLNIGIQKDVVKSGNIFSSTKEECYVIYNNKHVNDYFKYCLRVQNHGAMSLIIVNDFGVSKNFSKGKKGHKMEEEQTFYDLMNMVFDSL